MDDSGSAIVAVFVLAAVYCIGGLHGLLMAWSQPARMRRWARAVDCAADRIIAIIDEDPALQSEPRKADPT